VRMPKVDWVVDSCIAGVGLLLFPSTASSLLPSRDRNVSSTEYRG